MGKNQVGKLSHNERLARIRLARTKNVGAITFRHLVERFGNAVTAVDRLPELARRGGVNKAPKVPSVAEAQKFIDTTEASGAQILIWGDGIYPLSLEIIEDPPPYLNVIGHIGTLDRPALAIVGARNASAVGRKLAAMLAGDIGKAGYVVVSGLARGIDAAAHRGAIESGTIAVLGGGLDVYYPRENRELQEEIEAQGLLISEYDQGARPQARNFPRRNRIISGLSLGILVVEAAPRSGSLITARMALEQGREVFAVPGSPLDPRAQGANNLIRQGAILVQSADDILDAIRAMAPPPLAEPTRDGFDDEFGEQEPDNQAIDKARRSIAEQLSPVPVHIDDIVRSTGANAAEALAALLELELAGKAVRHTGHKFSNV